MPSIYFDSDGTILDSLPTKRAISLEVFEHVIGPQSDAVATHFSKSIGSREKKLQAIEKKFAIEVDREAFDLEFTSRLVEKIDTLRVREGLEHFRELAKDSVWFLVTNGSQSETRIIYEKLGINTFFDGGILGSPLSKTDHLTQLGCSPGDLLIGDSKEDFELAKAFGANFALLGGWNSQSDQDFFNETKTLEYNEFTSIADLWANLHH
jgi:phosphoglycolate phosphatase-like HAD superfamily hydrolase